MLLAHVGGQELGQLAGRLSTYDWTNGIFDGTFAREPERAETRATRERIADEAVVQRIYHCPPHIRGRNWR